MIFTIPIHHMLAVQAACAKNDTRWYLNGWHVDTSDSADPRIVGTNGHILVSMPITVISADNPPPSGENTFPVLKIRKNQRRHTPQNVVVYLNDEGSSRYQQGDTVAEMPDAIRGSFPDWRRVVARQKHPTGGAPQCRVAFNPSLVSKIQDALTLKGRSLICRMEFGKDEHDPIRVDFGIEGMVCVLMPCMT